MTYHDGCWPTEEVVESLSALYVSGGDARDLEWNAYNSDRRVTSNIVQQLIRLGSCNNYSSLPFSCRMLAPTFSTANAVCLKKSAYCLLPGFMQLLRISSLTWIFSLAVFIRHHHSVSVTWVPHMATAL